MSQIDPRTEREKTLHPVSSDPLAAFERRLSAMESRLGSDEVTQLVQVLRVLRQAVEEESARLQWFVKLGAQARALLEDLAPEPEEVEVPGFGAAISSALQGASPTPKKASAPAFDLGGVLASVGLKMPP